VAFFFRRVSTMALRVDDPFLASPPLPHEKLRTAVTARRVALLKLGYEPIPVQSGRKRPPMNGWQDVRITIPPDEDVITPWANTFPGALSTGIRTRHTPAFDIDILDQAVADPCLRWLARSRCFCVSRSERCAANETAPATGEGRHPTKRRGSVRAWRWMRATGY
jgi:hypothetical protein